MAKLTALVVDLFEPSMTAIHPLSAKVVAAASVKIKRGATWGQEVDAFFTNEDLPRTTT